MSIRQCRGGPTLYIAAGVVVLTARLTAGPVPAQPSPAETTALGWLDENRDYLVQVADRLWELPEPAHEEVETSQYLRGELARAGFRIETGVAGLPTAFVASYGSGPPVIGIVALMDALPGLSQEKLATERRARPGENAGHGCGHNLIGAADLGAAVAIRHALEGESLTGTIRFYGAPAEEIYHGGVYMVRAGAFDDVDALLFWHPSAVTTVIGRSGLAMDSVRFVFRGRASDATDAADKGIDALKAAYRFADAVADETWPSFAVVNHVLLEGGTIPSVVTEKATQWFFIHAPSRNDVERLRSRIDALAHDTADATGTKLEIQLLSSASEWLINRTLGGALQRHLEAQPFVELRSDETELARALQREFAPGAGDAFFAGVLPETYSDEPVSISDDTAEASWVTPRGGFLVACFPAGVPSHSWQWAASASSGFAHQGMMRAARTLAATTIDLLTDERLLEDVRREFQSAMRDRTYESPLPRDLGPFDYLKN